MNALENSAGR